jgi:hypothetical protein
MIDLILTIALFSFLFYKVPKSLEVLKSIFEGLKHAILSSIVVFVMPLLTSLFLSVVMQSWFLLILGVIWGTYCGMIIDDTNANPGDLKLYNKIEEDFKGLIKSR